MSSDPSAIIYYGFPIDNPDDDDIDSEDEDERDYHDTNDAWNKLKRPKEPGDRSGYKTAGWDAWRAELRKYEESPQHITIAWSGCEDVEKYYVNAEGLKKEVIYDNQLALSEMDLGPQPEADKYLKEFCEMFGIEFKQPCWHLAARYF